MSNKKTPNKGSKAVGYTCTCCGVEYKTQRGNFLSSSSPFYAGNNGFVGICRACTDLNYNRLLGESGGDAESAIERVAQLFDWYYDDKVVAATKDVTAPTTRVSVYPSKLNMVQFKASGKTYEDTIKERADKPLTSNTMGSDDNDETEAYKAPLQTINFFGPGYTNEQYGYLQEQYSDWTERYECETKAKEELFKAISISQLRIHEIQENGGSGKELEAAVKTFQSLLDSQDITPKKANIGGNEGQETFGTLIKRLENDRPVSEPQEQWLDVDGIHKYIDTWFFGQLCELVDVQNPKEDEYLEEKSKYTIVPPQQDDSFEGSESSLLDKLAKRKDGGDEIDEKD